MKKNLLQEGVKKEIIDRINTLKPESQRQWGRMNVNQMLRHTHDGLKVAYGDIKTEANKTTGIKRALMRFVIMKTDLAAPRGKAITMPEIDMVERGINPENFHAEKEALIQIVSKFPEKPTYHTSNMLGKMNDADWARLNYTHFDHHLKQFGA